MTLNFFFSCFTSHMPGLRVWDTTIPGLCGGWEWSPDLCARWAGTLRTELYPSPRVYFWCILKKKNPLARTNFKKQRLHFLLTPESNDLLKKSIPRRKNNLFWAMSFGNRSEVPFPWRHSEAALSQCTVACINWKTSVRRTCCKHLKGFMTLNDFSRIYAPPFLEILKKEIGSVTLLTASSCALDGFNGGSFL